MSEHQCVPQGAVHCPTAASASFAAHLPACRRRSSTGRGYAIGAETTVNGIPNNDQKENILWGFAGGYSITPWLGLKLQYVRSDRQVDVGNDSDRYIMSLSTFW